MKKYNIVTAVIIIVMLAGAVAMILISNKPITSEPDFDYLKNYKDNEYMPVYISEEKMASIYFNDYKYYLNNDLTSAFNLVNETYQKIKFSNFSQFRNFIEPYANGEVKSYRVDHINGKEVFYLKLTDDSSIIFATSGVMKYEVYFDESTITIE